MATRATTAAGRSLMTRWLPNEALAAAAVVLFVAAVAAIARGRPYWAELPPLIWLHLASILAATALTPVMLLRRKGDRPHRRLGHVWVAAMLLTAATSLFFNARVDGVQNWGVFSGDISPIHLLSVWVLVQVSLIVARARRHDRAGHEASVRGMILGALIVAGFFTFPFGRLLGTWLFT